MTASGPVAVWARNRPPGSTAAHLADADADRTLCGVMTGAPAPVVTCESCAYRFSLTPEGRRITRQATMTAIFAHLNATATTTAEVAALWEDTARSFEESR